MINCGLVGFGKIAADEHVPAIARTPGLKLVAVASRNARCAGVNNYPDLETMIESEPDLDAVILCQPPQFRFATARAALMAGKHVFLEKPPGASVSEVEVLRAIAQRQALTLFASWHSRWSPSVAALRRWLADKALRHVEIEWREDVRQWHPGQEWIWQSGGFGVFDPGINALSILTEVVPDQIRLVEASLEIPSNRAAPIGASLLMESLTGIPIHAVFDWRQTGNQIWEIRVATDEGQYVFSQGGDDAASIEDGSDSAIAAEYRAMYDHFAKLIDTKQNDVDLSPLQLVADAFLIGEITATKPYVD
jgi:D-galactose 1-dehydrogenase